MARERGRRDISIRSHVLGGRGQEKERGERIAEGTKVNILVMKRGVHDAPIDGITERAVVQEIAVADANGEKRHMMATAATSAGHAEYLDEKLKTRTETRRSRDTVNLTDEEAAGLVNEKGPEALEKEDTVGINRESDLSLAAILLARSLGTHDYRENETILPDVFLIKRTRVEPSRDENLIQVTPIQIHWMHS